MFDRGVSEEYYRVVQALPGADNGEPGFKRGAPMMNISGSVGAIVKRKGSGVWSVTPDQTVYEAIEIMADKAVGALLVISGGALAGIISERDYARKVILQGRSSKSTLIREIMTRNRIRHLPIVESEKVLGVVSIGDLVKWVISEQEETIEHLHNYISAKYPS